jgi:glycosyltransferase involved in cell wall biosynthesis
MDGLFPHSQVHSITAEEMKKKILVLPSWYPSNIHPINGVYIREQVLALSQKYLVAVLVPCFIGWRQILRGTITFKSQLEELGGVYVVNDGRAACIPRIPIFSYSMYARSARQGFEKLLSEWGRPDIIHAHVVLPAGWAATVLKKKYEIPVVLTEHSGPFSMHLKTSGNRQLVKDTLTRADRVITVSPALAQQIKDFIPTIDLQVLGNIINTDFFTPVVEQARDTSRSSCRFLTVAIIKKPKGLHYLLEAAHILTRRGQTSFELIIGGDGPQRQRLMIMAQQMGLSEKCRFLGGLAPSEVRNQMQQCDVFVLPSLQETFGIVLGEAMSCGKPVIATRCGGPEYVVTPETGFLVDVADPVALADAMERFILGHVNYDPTIIRQNIKERFGKEAYLNNISKVYDQLF